MAIHNAKEMGGSAMFCYSHNSQTGVGMSWNTNSYSTILDQNDLTNVTIEINDGKMKCLFTRPKETKSILSFASQRATSRRYRIVRYYGKHFLA